MFPIIPLLQTTDLTRLSSVPLDGIPDPHAILIGRDRSQGSDFLMFFEEYLLRDMQVSDKAGLVITDAGPDAKPDLSTNGAHLSDRPESDTAIPHEAPREAVTSVPIDVAFPDEQKKDAHQTPQNAPPDDPWASMNETTRHQNRIEVLHLPERKVSEDVQTILSAQPVPKTQTRPQALYRQDDAIMIPASLTGDRITSVDQARQADRDGHPIPAEAASASFSRTVTQPSSQGVARTMTALNRPDDPTVELLAPPPVVSSDLASSDPATLPNLQRRDAENDPLLAVLRPPVGVADQVETNHFSQILREEGDRTFDPARILRTADVAPSIAPPATPRPPFSAQEDALQPSPQRHMVWGGDAKVNYVLMPSDSVQPAVQFFARDGTVVQVMFAVPHTTRSGTTSIDAAQSLSPATDDSPPRTILRPGEVFNQTPVANAGQMLQQNFDLPTRWATSGAHEQDLSIATVPDMMIQAARGESTIMDQAKPASAPVAAQLSEAVVRALSRPVEVVLEPRELGAVRISMAMGEGAITLTILAERPDTLDLARRHADQLAMELRALGYDTINFTFGQHGSSSQQRDQQIVAPLDTDQQQSMSIAVSAAGRAPSRHETTLDIRI